MFEACSLARHLNLPMHTSHQDCVWVPLKLNASFQVVMQYLHWLFFLQLIKRSVFTGIVTTKVSVFKVHQMETTQVWVCVWRVSALPVTFRRLWETCLVLRKMPVACACGRHAYFIFLDLSFYYLRKQLVIFEQYSNLIILSWLIQNLSCFNAILIKVVIFLRHVAKRTYLHNGCKNIPRELFKFVVYEPFNTVYSSSSLLLFYLLIHLLRYFLIEARYQKKVSL